MRASEGRRTPPGSPPDRGAERRRRSSGFLYQTVVGNPVTKGVYYDSEQGVLLRPASNGGSKPAFGDSRLSELKHAKSLLDQKSEELRRVRKELDDIKTEATRRTSQARLFREAESNLKVEAETRRLELEDLKSQLSEQLKRAVALDAQIRQLKGETERLSQENVVLRQEKAILVDEVTKYRTGKSTSSSKDVDALEAELGRQQAQIQKLERAIGAETLSMSESVPELVLRVTLPGGRGAELVLDIKDARLIEERINGFARRHGLGPRAISILRKTVDHERNIMTIGE